MSNQAPQRPTEPTIVLVACVVARIYATQSPMSRSHKCIAGMGFEIRLVKAQIKQETTLTWKSPSPKSYANKSLYYNACLQQTSQNIKHTIGFTPVGAF